jgi:hypothetical protein
MFLTDPKLAMNNVELEQQIIVVHVNEEIFLPVLNTKSVVSRIRKPKNFLITKLTLFLRL